jgi:hypothetical protein
MSRCGGVLHYEVLAGARVFREVGGCQRFQFRCPRCGRSGENDGRDLTCESASNLTHESSSAASSGTGPRTPGE